MPRHTLLDRVFTGKWKSYKVIRYSGMIRHSGENAFLQFDFIDGRRTCKTKGIT